MARTKKEAGPGEKTVSRRIHFFRLVTRNDKGELVNFKPNPALQSLRKLPVKSKYQDKQDGSALLGWVDTEGSNPRTRLALIRRSDLPQIEAEGELSPLTLKAGAGLAEQAHLVFFPNSIVGAEFNFFGPRATSLASYLPTIVPDDCSWLSVRALLRNDVMQQLNKLRSVKLFELRIRPSDASVVSQADQDLGNAFKAASKVAKPPTVAITLGPNLHARGETLDPSFLGRLKALARNKELRATAATFKAEGYDADGELLPIDFLSDKLVSLKKMARLDNRSRAVNSDSAYRAIEEAYNELRAELNAAASLELT